MTLHALLKPGALAAATAAALLAACGGGGSSSTAPGTLRVALTDAPACGFDQVNVTVQKVRVHHFRPAAVAFGEAGKRHHIQNPHPAIAPVDHARRGNPVDEPCDRVGRGVRQLAQKRLRQRHALGIMPAGQLFAAGPVVASILPARNAARLTIREVLAYE